MQFAHPLTLYEHAPAEGRNRRGVGLGDHCMCSERAVTRRMITFQATRSSAPSGPLGDAKVTGEAGLFLFRAHRSDRAVRGEWLDQLSPPRLVFLACGPSERGGVLPRHRRFHTREQAHG